MSDPAATTTVTESRKLGHGCKALVAGMVVLTVGVGVGAGVAVRAKRINDEKREKTLKSLGYLAKHLDSPKRADNGRFVCRSGDEKMGWMHLSATNSVEDAACDAWDHPIYHRCPGPVHKNGWDLISCGPNGVYEEGGGDDIVVGEDLPGGLAAISSESESGTTESK